METPFDVARIKLSEKSKLEKLTKNTKGWNKVFQLKPTDATPFYVAISDGSVTLERGIHPSPVATIVMSASDMVDMLNGGLNPVQALLGGKLRIEGSLTEAQALAALIT